MSNIPDDIQKMFDKYSGYNGYAQNNFDNSSENFHSDNKFENNSNYQQDSSNAFESIFSSFFNKNNDNGESNNNPFGNIDINTIMKFKSIMDKMNSSKDNPRSNLLRSLKPYLKPSRKEKLEQYIGLLNMEEVVKGLGVLGGDNKK